MSRPALQDGYDRSKIAIDVQPGGPGNPWEWLGCVLVDALTAPQRSVTRREGPDPARAGEFKFAGFTLGEQGNVTLSMTLRRNKRDALKGLKSCTFGMRARYLCDGPQDLLTNWETMDGLCQTRITELGRSGWAVMESSENDNWVTIPVSLEAGDLYEYVARVAAERTQSDLVERAINKIRYYDWASCGDCERNPSDGCARWYAVTDAGGGTYPEPYFIVADLTQPAGSQYTLYSLDALTADATDFVIWGDIVVAISSDGWARSIDGGATWTLVQAAAVGQEPNALYANGRQIWAACNGGYIYKSDDFGVTWTAEEAGAATGEDLVTIDGYGDRVIVAAGDNRAFIRTKNGGKSWAAVTGPGDPADNLTVARIRKRGEVGVGNDVGEWYVGSQYGDAWTLSQTFGAGTGPITDAQFCGECGEGQFGWLLHNPPGENGVIYQDISDGVQFAAIQRAPTNNGFNSIACCDHSNAVVVGEIETVYGMIAEIEPDEV